MKESWVLKNCKADYEHIMNKFGISRICATLLANRGFTEDEDIDRFLNASVSDIPSYKLLKDCVKAIDIIKKAIDNGSFIRIVGDYDVDGVTATYLLLSALKELGAFVTYRIPDRIADGYGINQNIIKEAIEDGIDLIITCDNGISAKDATMYAKEAGLTVVVTDHHDIPDELPVADAIIDPKLPDCEYPNKGICGAMVAALLCEGLYESYNFGPFIEKNLDILAYATVCDVMELKDSNRIVVKEGLKQLNAHSRTGLKALAEVNNYLSKRINVGTLGYTLGPCINATGRLESAGLGVELLECDDYKEAVHIAEKLKELNATRKEYTSEGEKKAYEIIDSSDLINDSVLVVYIPNCHESLAGIIAGRVREKYDRPAIVLTDSKSDDTIIKGSGRSIKEYNMREKLNEVQDILLKFGGHPMAAGMSLLKSDYEEFRKRLNSNSNLNLDELENKIYVDASVPCSSFSLKIIDEVAMLEPTGTGNESAKFYDKVIITKISFFGAEKQYITLDVLDSRKNPIKIKLFRNTEVFIEDFKNYYGETLYDSAVKGKDCQAVLDVVYGVSTYEFNGMISIDYSIIKYKFPRRTC